VFFFKKKNLNKNPKYTHPDLFKSRRVFAGTCELLQGWAFPWHTFCHIRMTSKQNSKTHYSSNGWMNGWMDGRVGAWQIYCYRTFFLLEK
jgi:hypothetical protein